MHMNKMINDQISMTNKLANHKFQLEFLLLGISLVIAYLAIGIFSLRNLL